MKRLGIVAVARPENGGQFQYTLSMIEALSLLSNWKMTIYCPTDSEVYTRFGMPTRNLKFSKSRAVALALLSGMRLPRLDIFEEEDAVIAPMYTPHLLHTNTPFCYTLHDLQERYFPEYFSWHQRRWRAFMHGALSKSARRILCESEFVHRDIVSFLGVPEKNICVIPAPPLNAQVTAIADKAHINRKYNISRPFFFYPAQFWAHKNHARLIEAFAQIVAEFPSLQLILTGHRQFEFEAVMQRVLALGLTERVRHIGYVEDGDLSALYENSVALVMPSLFESISIPIYEAFRAGTPVCASGILGLNEQIGDAGLTFDPLSTASIADSMRQILRENGLREKFISRGRERLSLMTPRRYALQLERMLLSALVG